MDSPDPAVALSLVEEGLNRAKWGFFYMLKKSGLGQIILSMDQVIIYRPDSFSNE